ncbi:hypothetical protein [Salinisphaera orenii]|uniref:hypothetical protein n=1 Tax=Salinisphaera orenii TaxID=856731 RepID=UPI000DBE5BED
MTEGGKWDMIGDPVGRYELRRIRVERRRRIALATAAVVIALSLTALSGCSDDTQNASGSDSQSTSQASSEQSKTDDPGQRHDGDGQSDLPVDVESHPKQTRRASKRATDSDDRDDRDDRLKALRQTVQQHKRHTRKKLHAQGQRIDKLEQHVQTLRKRVAELKQTTHKRRQAANDPSTAAGTNQSIDVDQPPTRPIRAVQIEALVRAATTDNTSDSSDSDADDSGDSGDTTDVADDSADDASLTTVHCARTDTARTAFNIVYPAKSRKAVESARQTATQAGITDLFKTDTRLYLGRYNHCAPARKRRREIFQKTELVASLDRAHIHDHTGQTAQADVADPSNDTPAPHGDAPFHVLSMARHGSQQAIGVATGRPRSRDDISWLYPGQRYHHWQLKAIHKARGTATFAKDDHSVSVDLPIRS